ncbi:hypothetical protein [Nocardioides sp. InS609-2]|uniref:CG0192-related protein n=1 Tax=Nocardioides sp. InS609-2 TaxID=2760705 RepID=UPI0020BE3681|nr:hypothetical protein [Nocardioides sp. InS609-2]
MALLHQATLTPSKRELMDGWLPSRSWFPGTADLEPIGAYRIDDPAGEVGIEGFLLGSPDSPERPALHLPLTYRDAPLAGAEAFLVGTMEHSVLGKRWVYDACGDPVFARALAATVLNGDHEADLFIEVDGEMQQRKPTVTVRGTGTGTGAGAEIADLAEVVVRDVGSTTVIEAGPFELVVVRVVGTDIAGDETLVAHWPGVDTAVLAGVRRR